MTKHQLFLTDRELLDIIFALRRREAQLACTEGGARRASEISYLVGRLEDVWCAS